MTTYTGESIEVLEGREAVRERPGMYIGGTSKKGLHHILWELVDNAVDEAMNDHADEITVTLHGDRKTLTVEDNGRGIPVDEEEKSGRSALEVVFTKLHAGAKFESGSSYKGSGGLHGVGAAVTNFLSKHLTARVRRDERVYEINFEEGIPQKEVEQVGTYSKYSNRGTGTEITFEADPFVFPDTEYDGSHIAEILEVKTYLNPGLKIVFKDEYNDSAYEFCHEEGVVEYLDVLIEEDHTEEIHDDPIVIRGESEADQDEVRFEIAFQWTEDTDENIKTFVNSIPTPEGGTHELGFRQGLVKAVRSYLETSDSVPKRLDIQSKDIREGIKGMVNTFYEGEIQFQSQNKTRLNNPEIKPVISKGVKNQLEEYLFNNSETAEKIAKRIVAAAKARKKARSSKKKSYKKTRSAKKLALPGKLADCSEDDPTECEIFIVEGDSAGGNAKMARDQQYQAILPLKGKVLNVENSSLKSVMKNKELSGIVEALGCGIGDEFDLSKLRYHKIILLMDADSDGHHISTLLLTFFYRHMPELIENGHVYIAQPPLYQIRWGTDRLWARSDEEKDRITDKLASKDSRKNIEVSRFKGLGEMQADTLKETTLRPATRSLMEIDVPESKQDKTDEVISNLMGNDSSKRYDMIVENLELVDGLDV